MGESETLILTVEEVRQALYLDDDFPEEEATALAKVASSFIKEKVDFDFGSEDPIEPLAKQAAQMHVKHLYFNGAGYNPAFDMTFGLTGILIDLQNLAREELEEVDEE